MKYRLNTLFSDKNLALEVPAYCAAARVRLANGWTRTTARATVLADMLAAMGDALDSATIHRAVTAGCPEL